MVSLSSLSLAFFLFMVVVVEMNIVEVASEEEFRANYADALKKSILFYEGQRSGKLPPAQRMKWRKNSALIDGQDVGLDLTGGYYDAGDNVKYNFPMAYTITVLSWSVIEYGKSMGQERTHALQAIRWATDYFIRCTNVPDKVFVQVGDPNKDHICWERPEDMDTDRTSFAVDKDHPGSEVSSEIAAALASASIALKDAHPAYSVKLLQRATAVFDFADKYRGNYSDYLPKVTCPFYCNWSGYEDELLWAASWLYIATKKQYYWDYVIKNLGTLDKYLGKNANFGWDDKHAGIYVLITNELIRTNNTPKNDDPFRSNADKFVCTMLPESPTRGIKYSPGGLMFSSDECNMQTVTAVSFLLLTYARYLSRANQVVHCGDKIATPQRIISVAKDQVDYILGKNPLKMSYMVGYGDKFPQKVHHRGSTLPSIDQHPGKLGCWEGAPYFKTENPNPNLLTGALVGGPGGDDKFNESRYAWYQTEPTTYYNAPAVGLLGFFNSNENS